MTRLLVVPAVLASVVACNGILGIEEATADPNFDGGARDGADAGTAVSCTAYCDVVTANCSGANQQYFDRDTCLEMCPGFARGGPRFDTLECRFNAAKAAFGNKPTECLAAGLFGEGACSGREPPTQCEPFCGLTLRLCGPNGYPDLGACIDACKGMRYEGGGRLFGDAGPLDQSRNTLDCRMTHLMIGHSVKNDPQYRKLHCEHTRVPSDTCAM